MAWHRGRGPPRGRDIASRCAAETGARFESSSPADLAARGDRFDVTICSEMLEHLDEPLSMLRTLRQLTTPSGLCLVTVPAGYGAYEMAVRFQRFYAASFLRVIYRNTLKPIVGRLLASPADALTVKDDEGRGGTLNEHS